MKISNKIILGIIFVSFIAGVWLYPQMPERMASHWNTKGEVDRYMLKFWGLFLMPLISIGLFLLFLIIPKIDPLKKNIEKFRKYYDEFIMIMVAFLFYIFTLTIVWNLGERFNMGQVLMPALALLFYYVGILLENVKRNWFIGIRTPWTLSSDKVWEKTHKIGAKLFKALGVIALLGFLFPKCAVFFVLIPVILVALYLIVHSYLEFQKEGKLLNKIRNSRG